MDVCYILMMDDAFLNKMGYPPEIVLPHEMGPLQWMAGGSSRRTAALDFGSGDLFSFAHAFQTSQLF